MTPAEMQADFDLLRRALEEAHPGLYRYSTKAEMGRRFDAQRAKLSGAMAKGKFEAVLAETLAQIRCGHTSMKLDDELEAALKSARTLPLRVLTEGGQLLVLLNDTPDDRTIRPGMEILEINGHKAADLLGRFLPMAPADGDIESGKRRDIVGRFAQYYWWLVEQPDDFTVKATEMEGKTVTVKLTGVTDAERKKNQNPVNDTMKAGMGKLMGGSRENLSLRFLKDPQIAEIRVRSFVGDDYRKWVHNTFKTLRERGAETLIIDLRGNGGGDDMYGALLVSYLTDKPFRYFDHINVKTITPSFKEHTDMKVDEKELARFREGSTANPAGGYSLTSKMHPGLAEQQPGKNPFLGKVFVLTDGGTFSTASDFCAVVHHLKRATFVGEETGGCYYGNNSGMMPTLTLPNSKVKVRLPLYEYWNAVATDDGKRRGTRPDHVMELKTADLLRGVDGQLEQARKLAADSAAIK
jgi:C-terminal processing protease CtpA/Prc